MKLRKWYQISQIIQW